MKKFHIIVVILFFVVSGIFYFWQIKQENKTEELPSSIFSQIEQEAILALKGLGFLQSVATNAVAQAKNSSEGQKIKDTASLVKLSLKYV